MKSNDLLNIPQNLRYISKYAQNHPNLQVSNEAKANVLLLTKSDYQISLK